MIQGLHFVFQVKFSANLQPKEIVTFHLRYEELLQRSNHGKYSYVVNVQPQRREIVDFRLNVNIEDALPLERISVLEAEDKDAAKFQAEDITEESLISNKESSAQILRNAAYSNQDRKFYVDYDVKRPEDGNSLQFHAGKFIHFFAPDNRPTLPKHIIFVIDISGSMEGRKLVQTKDAMTTMLTQMSKANLDNFNIIDFASNVKVWRPAGIKGLSYDIPNKNGKVSAAYDYLLQLEAGGFTNIDGALLQAVNLASEVARSEEIKEGTQQMIVFLTDGEPTEGETSGTKIRKNLLEINAQLKIPIFGLAFGDNADFTLIKDISKENNGFAQKIYEAGNSYEQLEDFYNKVSGENLHLPSRLFVLVNSLPQLLTFDHVLGSCLSERLNSPFLR